MTQSESATNGLPPTIAYQATCVMVDGRGVLIQGVPGSGKSSLALALIDRGAALVGDDSVLLDTRGGRLFASPHPNTAGKLEVRNLGLIDVPCVGSVPLALVIKLDREAPRYISVPETAVLANCVLPQVRLFPDTPALVLRVEVALRTYGLAAG
jgi:serine kinase of HPr protein (carbohydrate metabolism regulator)